MPSSAQDLPLGHSTGSETPIRSSVELGVVIREQRKRLALKQLDLAGLGNTGNRFIVDLENGKPTVQLQKVLDLMDLLGLEVVVRTKASRSSSSL
jgi:y4mF family transcriptional regulator